MPNEEVAAMKGGTVPLVAISANSSWNLLNFCRGLIEGLQEQGYALAALVPPDEGTRDLERLGVAVYPIPLSQHGRSPLSDLWLTVRYAVLLRRLRPAAYLGVTAKPNIYGSIAAQLNGIPTINSVTGLGTGFLGSRRLETLISALYRAAFRRTAKVFFLNRDDYDLFLERRLVSRQVADVIRWSGIDLDWFRPAAPARNKDLTFLFIGRILTDKGVREYLEAARLVKAKLGSVRFQLLGPTDPHPKAVPASVLERFVADGTVEYLGSTDDVRPFIAASDCVVLPSYREGLPRVLVEAAAMARPAIASDVPGCRDVVVDGATGYLCEAKSAESLASAMLRFAGLGAKQRAEMGQRARARAERDFADADAVKAFIQALEPISAVGARRARPVLVVSANSCWALSNYRMGLLKAFQARGFRVVAAVPDDDGIATLRDAGIGIEIIPISPHGTSPVSDLKLLASYWALLRRLRPSAFLGFTIKPNIYGSLAASAFGVPVLNNVTGLGMVFERKGLLQSLVSRLYRRALRKSRRVFFQNRESMELFRSLRFVNEGQAALLPGSGIDLQRFAAVARKPDSKAPFTFLLASRLMWQKGIAEYCEAGRWIRDNRPGARFQLLGAIEPPSNKSAIPREDIDRWVEECGVEYLGPTGDVRPYIANADCIVLPSYYPEGVPRALIEAAAMAKPIITTDTPGCRDVVDEGRTGFLCEPRSAESLVEAMVRMLDLPEAERAAMGRRAREKAERQYDERYVIDAYLAEIGELRLA